MNKLLLSASILSLCCLAGGSLAGDKPFADTVPVLTGSPPEGFAIGRGSTAYNGGVDGAIYKVDLRSGEGEVLVPAEPGFDIFTDCYKLGMRVDRRTNYLFVAGCAGGNAYVFDADSGEELANYQLIPEFSSVINDLVITRDAVYFTDSFQPFLYRLPLGKGGQLPADESGITAIALPDAFINADPFCCSGNGIVATPDGKTLILGQSNTAQLFRLDPASGEAQEIPVDPPLVGFLDGMVMDDNVIYILTPFPEGVQVVALDDDMASGIRVGNILNSNMAGIASGAFFGGALYVNNARYDTFPEADTEYWVTRVDVEDIQP